MRIRLAQWAVTRGSEVLPMFTLSRCTVEQARAIAAATFGRVQSVDYEGDFTQEVPD